MFTFLYLIFTYLLLFLRIVKSNILIMKKSKAIFLVLVLILINIDVATAQLKLKTYKKKPLVIFDIYGSLDVAALNLHGANLEEFWGLGNYGQSIGYGGEFKFKISVLTRKMTQLRPYLAIGYAHFTRDEGKTFIQTKRLPAGWPGVGLSGTGQYTSISTSPGSSTFRMNIPYLALGTELAVYTDRKNLSSFNFGLDVNMSVIFGRHTETYTDGSIVEYNLPSNTRFGVGGNIVYNYRLSKAFGINVGTRFQFVNLLGSESKVSNTDNEFYLLDKQDPSLSPLLSDSREIGFFRFFGGFSFYVGNR
jgi:hypothetical protein